MKRALKLIVALIAVSYVGTANAAVLCRGPVTNIIVGYGTGDLEITWGTFGQIKFCNISANATTPYGTTVPKETCVAIMTQALSAYGTGKDFGVYTSAAITDCASLRDPANGWVVSPGPARTFVYN